jgi:hypothetical protein
MKHETNGGETNTHCRWGRIDGQTVGGGGALAIITGGLAGCLAGNIPSHNPWVHEARKHYGQNSFSGRQLGKENSCLNDLVRRCEKSGLEDPEARGKSVC